MKSCFVCVLLFVLCVQPLSAQSDGVPRFKKQNGLILSSIAHVLHENLDGESKRYAAALFFIKFQVDTDGNVCNIRFSNAGYTQQEGLEKENIDSAVRQKINSDIAGWLLKTNGSWIPAKTNGKAEMSKPLVIVVDCNGPVGSKVVPQDDYRFDPFYGPVFPGEENQSYIILGGLTWNGRYKV